jgi:uncharacterized glyoxalase superfamily protein PhnB
MTRITRTRYVLAVPDVVRSAAYYRDVLGFTVESVEAGGLAYLHRDGCRIMLGECREAIPASELGDHAYFAYIEVDNARYLFAELKSRGAIIRSGLADRPWGMREFTVATPDGHRLMFGEPIG